MGTSGRNQLGDPAATDGDQRKFGGDKKAVSENEAEDSKKFGSDNNTTVFARHGLLAIWAGRQPQPPRLPRPGPAKQADAEPASCADLCESMVRANRVDPSDKNRLQLLNLERFLVDRMTPPGGPALEPIFEWL
jgi:hypothetical protein